MNYKSVLEHIRRPPMLTLQEICCMKIITTLCNNEQLLDLILRCNFLKVTYSRLRLSARRGAEWRAVRTTANELLSQVSNCVLLNKKILELLWPVSYRIMLWKYTYAPSIRNTFLQHFFWTDRGRIHNTRTARHLIGSKDISNRKKFILACSLCLEKEIREIWIKMSVKDKAYFYANNRERIFPLLRFWVHALEGPENVLERYVDEAVSCAKDSGLFEAVKFFYAIVPEEDKDYIEDVCLDVLIAKLIDRDLLKEDENDIGCFVFYQMREESRESKFNDNILVVLSLLLHRSEYRLCLNLMTEILKSERDIYIVLDLIFFTQHLEVVDNDDCRKLFVDFWQMIPISERNFITQTGLGVEYLSFLIRDNFPFLLEEEAFKKIAELTSRDIQASVFVETFDFHQGKWKFLLFLIEEEVVTVPLMKQYKTQILNYLKKRHSNEMVWDNIVRFVRKFQRKNPEQKQ